MAITKIHAVKASVQKAVDYICNPDKTEGRILVDSFACTPQTAGHEFDYILSHGTGQGDNKAFHLIQSFATGEVTPEKAHKLGKELADRLLQGNYSYVLATHTNTRTTHNHLIFCACNNFDHKKYLDTKNSYKYLRHLSDEICRENGISVIEDPSGRRGISYKEWMSDKAGKSWKTQLKNDIRACIKSSDSYDMFIQEMTSLGYEIKGSALSDGKDGSGGSVSKYISFRAPGYDHFVRGSFRTLGKGFTKEEIASEIIRQRDVREARAPMPVKSIYDYKPKADIRRKTEPFTRLIDTSDVKFMENVRLKKWADKKNLQAVAHAYAGAGSLAELNRKIDDAEKNIRDINDEIIRCEKTLSELKELSVYVQNYQRYKVFDSHYRAAKDREAYYEAHESQLMIYDAAVRHIRESGMDPKQVSYKQVMDGIQKMQERSESLKEKYRGLHDELRDMTRQKELIREYLKKPEQKDYLISSKNNRKHEI